MPDIDAQKNKKIISPSILSANFANLQAECEMINSSEAEWLHIDVMDGCFVPNISFGFPVIKAIRKHCKKILDVHLMIVNPEKYIDRFAQSGADIITFHHESTTKHHEVIASIRANGALVGITINPDVPVDVLEPYIDKVDLVLLMTVFAGYAGQQFIEESYERLDALRKMVEEKQAHCLIEVDGGISLQNATNLFAHGANVLVAGSAIFNTSNPTETIHKLLIA